MIKASCGLEFSVFIDNSGSVCILGNTLPSQRYYTICGYSKIYGFPKIKQLSAGYFHFLCLDYNRNVWSFGSSTLYQTGSNNDVVSPFCINSLINIESVHCGAYFSICKDDNGNLWSFGDNKNGQLGIGKIGGSCETPQLVKTDILFDLVSCGGNHCLCLSNHGKLYSFGCNISGQLGQGHFKSLAIPTELPSFTSLTISDISCGYSHTLIIDIEGNIYGCGLNYDGQIGNIGYGKHNSCIKIPQLPPIQAIYCGFEHTCCIDLENNLWTFGSNEYNQLGRYKSAENQSNENPCYINIKTKSCSYGGRQTIILDLDNTIWIFGNNLKQQLGSNKRTKIEKPQKLLEKYQEQFLHERISKAKSARK